MNMSLTTLQHLRCYRSSEKLEEVFNKRPLQYRVGTSSKYSFSKQSQLLLNVPNETPYAILRKYYQDVLVATLLFFLFVHHHNLSPMSQMKYSLTST